MILGVFGIVAFRVASRTRELGVRLALGAAPSGLVRLMVREALMSVGLGLFLGFGLTFWASRISAWSLFEVATPEISTLTLAACVVLASATVAAYVPARRATRVDPLVVLRVE